MRIGVTKEITPDKLLIAKNLGLEGLLFAKINKQALPSELSTYKLFDATTAYPDASWYCYEKITKQLHAIKAKVPKFFVYQGYDLFHAFCKELYWAFLFENLIEYSEGKLALDNNTLYKLDAPRPLNVFTKFLYLFCFQSTRKNYTELERKSEKSAAGKLALRVNSLGVLPFYGYLLDALGRDNIVSFQSSFSGCEKVCKTLQNKFFLNYGLLRRKGKAYRNKSIKLIRLFFSKDLEFVNQLIICKSQLIHHIRNYEWLAQQGVAGFLVDAGENEGECHVMGQVAKKFNIKSYNYINGTKAKDPIHQNTTFDYWFMHDEGMQKMLLSYANLKEENLPVTGHLLKDVAAAHVYTGTLDEWLKKAGNKKIISLFTSPLFNKEKIDVCNFLDGLTRQRNDILVLIRKHPADLSPISCNNCSMIVLPDFKEKSADNLFDLFLKSHLAISFASTVSYQAPWFNIPSVNFEYRGASMLTYIDSQKIFHINSIESLNKFIAEVLSKPSNGKESKPTDELVALKIAEIIKQSSKSKT